MRKNRTHEAQRSAMQIPQGMENRRDFLMWKLQRYAGRTFFCKALGVNIKVNADSVKETAYNAAASRKSTKLALFLPYILRNANVKDLHLPTESNKQKKVFRFVDVAVLRCNVPKVGVAKIVVGYKYSGRTIEYSITDFQIVKTKIITK